MFKELMPYVKKPVLFAKGTANMWDDPHISKHMLEAHLDPTWDAASRRPETIDKTIEWLKNYLPAQAAVLDLGCGPGLYAERLASLGHNCAGIDFSRRSIEYAKESAQGKGLSINYVYQNYLEIGYHEEFDLIILIFCDLGALVKADRDLLLQKVYKALKPGGVFIFDVFTEGFSNSVEEKQSWELTDDGFWAEGAHCVLSQTFHYPEEKVQLNQYIVVREDRTHDVYRCYDRYYTESDLSQMLNRFGFANHHFAYDVIGETNFATQKVVFAAATK